MFILPKENYGLMQSQNFNDIFHRKEKNNTKFHMEPQRPQIAETILRKKNKAIGIACPNFSSSSFSLFFRDRERGGNIDWLFHLFMHSLVFLYALTRN